METLNTKTEQQEVDNALDRAYALLQEAYDLLLGIETSNCNEDFKYTLQCATEAIDEAQQQLYDCDASEAMEMVDEEEEAD